MFDRLHEAEKVNRAAVLVTITQTKGSVPRKTGRMAVFADGTAEGTVGGGICERRATEEALISLKENRNRAFTVPLPKGECTMITDVVIPERKLFVMGFGHVGEAIARLMHSCGYAVYVFDRSEVKCDYALEVHHAPSWSEVLRGLKADSHTAVIVTVHDKSEILASADFSDAFYVGLLSSRAGSSVTGPNCYSPMGLDIGAETPEEIAVSVAAEIMKAEKGKSGRSISRDIRRCVLVRGSGDLATAVMIRLHNAGYNVIGAELENPTQIRRNVSFAEAMYEGVHSVSGVTAKKIHSPEERFDLWKEGIIPVIADEKLEHLGEMAPQVVVDAIIAKRNLGTRIDMAPLVIALGPGFTAGVDCHRVIETMRGHSLGAIIKEGRAAENTGIPGIIMGYGKERVVRSPADGVFNGVKTFGDIVKKGETIAYVDDVKVEATIDGMVRGMLRSGLKVTPGFKIADIDPRGEGVKYDEPSDKARAIAGSVLECVDAFFSDVNIV
ncbi:MAG: selenium-dependent molybdenum cofactor biosynthesis protein YqeB [Bullifex sp.]